PIVFGVVASICCYFAIQLKAKYGYDDSLDVVGIHMVGGIVGGVLAMDVVVGIALIWGAHIGFDRALGFGLKLPTGFRDTHLGRIGKG
ncbi:MAG: DUF4260 family protein, partial [Bacteroidota bacterium]